MAQFPAFVPAIVAFFSVVSLSLAPLSAQQITVSGDVTPSPVVSPNWNVSSLQIGNSGSGSLRLESGGTIANSGSAYFGLLAGSNGSATVNGGTWNNSQIFIGEAGTGELVINGGLVSANSGGIGTDVGGSGRLIVNGGALSIAQGFIVGNETSAYMEIAGGTVSSTFLRSSTVAGVVSELIVSSGALSTTSGMDLGFRGETFLTITGGTLSGNQNRLGTISTGTGTATMSGGTWNSTTDFVVGYGGTGILSMNGGLISDANGIIGSNASGVGTVTATAGTWNSSTSLTIGKSGRGTLEIQGDAVVSVSGGAGLVTIAEAATSTGTLNFGAYDLLSPTSVGTLNAAGIVFGSGSGVINFNQSDAFVFSTPISGAGQVVQRGSGVTTFTGANSYSAGTTVSGGTLRTTDASALGTGLVTLSAGGTLNPVGTLAIDSLGWNGGTIAANVGTSTSFLDIANDLSLTGLGVFSFSADSGALAGTEYAILSAANLASYTSADFLGTGNAFFRLDAGTNTLFVSFLASGTGPVLQNSGPYFTLEASNFVVNGPVVTGGPADSNTVNSLTFTSGSSLQVFNTLTVTSGGFTVPTGTAAVAGGTVVVPGAFSKLGSGVLNFLSDVFVNGPANVFGGTLRVNGTFTTGGLTVFQNALLGGSGVITGNVVNNGTVAPGNSPGTLTINGNFTQTGRGTLQIEAAGNSIFDRLIVRGRASLAGTLQVLSFGGFRFKYGQQFHFLQAGSINGEFDNVTVTNPDKFRGRFLVDGGSGTVVIAPRSYALAAVNQNQQNVAKALDSFIPATSGDREEVSAALDILTSEQYPDAFDAIMPGFYSSLVQVSLEQMTAQNQFIAQRLSAVRLGANGFNAQGLNMPLANDRDGKSVMEAKDAKTVITPANATRWALWVQGSGIFGRMSLTNLPTNRFASGGFLGGADYRWSENFSTGIYSGYQGTYSKYSNGSSSTINSTLFGLYGTYQNGDFYSDAIIGGAYNNYSNRRAIEFSTIDRTGRSNVDGGQLTAYLDAGYDFTAGKFTFGPLASVQYTYTGLGGFTESGADSLDLAVGQYNANSIRTNLGGRIAYTWNVTDRIVVTPEVRMFWQHEYLNDQQTMSASLEGGAGPGFGYTPSATGQDSVIAGAGVSAQFGPNWNAYFYYNADFGRQDYVGQMISTGLNWKF